MALIFYLSCANHSTLLCLQVIFKEPFPPVLLWDFKMRAMLHISSCPLALRDMPSTLKIFIACKYFKTKKPSNLIW